jgi:hypothetical protein
VLLNVKCGLIENTAPNEVNPCDGFLELTVGEQNGGCNGCDGLLDLNV